jgi:squalene-hopene/tetraprenyl-beta-curcumene cyclase
LVTLDAQLERLSLAACDRLAEERSSEYSEAAHTMTFLHRDGFTGRDEVQRGDIFARALIADALCDARDAGILDTSATLHEECDYLIARRQQSGVGGWSYFPDLPELAPDTDCLAQVMQVLVRCERTQDLLTYIEPPLQILLSEGVHSTGAIDTWIVTKHNCTPEQTRQAALAATLQGTKFDVEVIANFLYALVLYAPHRFADLSRRGVHYIRSRQESAGFWPARWYDGPYYGTYVCSRFLKTAGDDEALSRARAFLLDSQLSDGGWSKGEGSDQLSTALGVCGLIEAATPLGRQLDDLEFLARGVRWLAASWEQRGWQSPCFIRRAARVRYGSSAITACYALKMVAAVRKVFSRSN